MEKKFSSESAHLHMLVLDGVYANERDTLRFQPLPAPAPAMMAHLLDVIVLRVLGCLEGDGVLIQDLEQPWLDLAVLTRFGVRRVGRRSQTRSAR